MHNFRVVTLLADNPAISVHNEAFRPKNFENFLPELWELSRSNHSCHNEETKPVVKHSDTLNKITHVGNCGGKMARVSRVDSYENSSTVKYAQVKNGQVELRISRTFFHFSTKAALCMTNFTADKSKSDKSNFIEVKHVFCFPTRISRSQFFQAYIIVEFLT